MAAQWEISWAGAAAPVTGSEPTLPEARSAAETAATAISDLWGRPGVSVKITGPSGGVWCLMPKRQKAGQFSWRRASLRTTRVPVPIRVIGGIDIPRLLEKLHARRLSGAGGKPDPLCCEAAAAIKALGGAAA